MRNFYIVCSLLISTAFLNAQITLTNTTSVPTAGSTFTYHSVSNFTFDVSQIGADQTWDFSSAIPVVDGDSNNSFVDASNTIDATSFPNASLAIQNNFDTSVSYLSSSEADLSFEGFYLENELRTIFTDKRELFKFPITFNDTFNETFTSSTEYFTDNTFGSADGTIEFIADGYGTLILPYATVNDVLKVKVTELYTNRVIDGVSLPDYTTISNYWFNTSTKLFLASTNEQIIDGATTLYQANYISQPDLVLSIDDIDSSSKVSIYPNPSNDHFILKNELHHNFVAHIYDTKGLLIKSLDVLNGENRININDLSTGIYLLKFQSNYKNYTKKLVVK